MPITPDRLALHRAHSLMWQAHGLLRAGRVAQAREHYAYACRVFADADDKMNLSLENTGGGILVISQFTLYASTKKGNRPSFTGAAKPELAETLYEEYVAALRRALGNDRVATGRFGALMSVEITNDGPVTIELTTDS